MMKGVVLLSYHGINSCDDRNDSVNSHDTTVLIIVFIVVLVIVVMVVLIIVLMIRL